ncbi:hypothetical protein AMCSP13_002856 [Streptococcus pneumoniae 2070335]|nr:hypothetical protein AMCSP13_002856 [Streptococcus pneumoniae 2070335]
MKKVEPIRDLDDIERIKDYLKTKVIETMFYSCLESTLV